MSVNARSYVMVSLLKKLQELHTKGPAPYNHGICTQLNGTTHLERGCTSCSSGQNAQVT